MTNVSLGLKHYSKTTLLNTLSSFISNEDRIITIEDAAELQLQQEHVVRLETRPPGTAEKTARGFSGFIARVCTGRRLLKSEFAYNMRRSARQIVAELLAAWLLR